MARTSRAGGGTESANGGDSTKGGVSRRRWYRQCDPSDPLLLSKLRNHSPRTVIAGAVPALSGAGGSAASEGNVNSQRIGALTRETSRSQPRVGRSGDLSSPWRSCRGAVGADRAAFSLAPGRHGWCLGRRVCMTWRAIPERGDRGRGGRMGRIEDSADLDRFPAPRRRSLRKKRAAELRASLECGRAAATLGLSREGVASAPRCGCCSAGSNRERGTRRSLRGDVCARRASGRRARASRRFSTAHGGARAAGRASEG